MRIGRLLALALAVASISLLDPQGAAAATEVGSNCVADEGIAGYTFLQVTRAPLPGLSVTVPSAGVITSWKVRSGVVGAFLERLVTFQAGPGPNEYKATARSAEELVVAGNNTFNTRIPVAAGERIGESSSSSASSKALLCDKTGEEDQMAYKIAPASVGTTFKFETAPNYQVPIIAVIEPDVDGDGYGDETQDGCPQSAAFQTACPLVAVDSLPLVKKGSVTVLLTTSTAGQVAVSGAVKLGKGKRAVLKGGSHPVAPGTVGSFKLKFSKELMATLAGLSRKDSLALKVTVSATNLSGVVTTSSRVVKLKGQG